MTWPTKKLGELEDEGVIELGRGNVISKNDIEQIPGDYPIYSSSQQNEGEFGRYAKFMFDEELVTWSVDGGGKFFYRPKHKYSVTNVCGWMRVIKPDILNCQFLYFTLNFSHRKFNFDYTFKAHPSVIRKMYKVLIPPLKIQKQIVERLDKIAEAQKLNDGLIQKSDELYRSLLHNELNSKIKSQNAKSQFKIKKLEEIAEVTSSKRIYQGEYVKDGIPFYRTKEIVELSQNKPISLELFISEKRFNEIKEKFGAPKKGDILISAVGTIGISWVVSDDRQFYFKDGNLLWIKNLKGIDPIYLKMVLGNFAKNIARMGVGAAYNALTIIKLKKIQISVPTTEIQKQIVAKLSAVQDYKKTLLEQKQKFRELFESVLNKSMGGEL